MFSHKAAYKINAKFLDFPHRKTFSIYENKLNNQRANSNIIKQIDHYFFGDQTDVQKVSIGLRQKKQHSIDNYSTVIKRSLTEERDKKQLAEQLMKDREHLDKLIDIFQHSRTNSMNAQKNWNKFQGQHFLKIESCQKMNKSDKFMKKANKTNLDTGVFYKRDSQFSRNQVDKSQSLKLQNHLLFNEKFIKLGMEQQTEASPRSNLGQSIERIFSERNVSNSKQSIIFDDGPTRQTNYFIKRILVNLEEPNLQNLIYHTWIENMYQDLRFKGPFTSKAQLQENIIQLTQNNPIRRVVLGLDKTLIFCKSSGKSEGDFVINVDLPNGRQQTATIKIRPYCTQLIEYLAKHFQIVVFSASHKNYVNKVLEQIDKNKLIKRVYHSEHCVKLGDRAIVKNISLLSKNLKDTLFIDTHILSYCKKINQIIPVLPYYGESDDQELKSLIDFIKNQVIKRRNPIGQIKQYFKLQKWHQYQNGYQAVQSLYK